ncbi:unnamed protein product [Arabidopsis halleri]
MKGKDIMKKKTRVPCNFCQFSSSRYISPSEQSLQDQDNEETVLRKEVVRLRSLIRRMTGRDDDASFTELQALTSHLKNVKRIVMDQMDKIMPPDQVESKQVKDHFFALPVLLQLLFFVSLYQFELSLLYIALNKDRRNNC